MYASDYAQKRFVPIRTNLFFVFQPYEKIRAAAPHKFSTIIIFKEASRPERRV
jgi:hypothetical protein